MSRSPNSLEQPASERPADASESLEQPVQDDDQSDSIEVGEPPLVSPPSEGRLFLMAALSAVVGFGLYIGFQPESGGLVLLSSLGVLVVLLFVDGYQQRH